MLKDFLNRWSGRNFIAAIMILVCSIALAPSLFSQSASTGALTGTAKDSSGAVLPNVTVTATNIGTGQVRTDVTNGDGTYRFGLIAPGNYRLKFEATGFSTIDVPSVTVAVTETAVLDETLQVGAQSQQIEVTSEAEVVQTASTAVGTVLDSKEITDTPLTSRNYTNLLGLSSGANASVFNASNIGKGTQDISVNGSTTSQNNFMQDGAPIVAWTGNGYASDSGGSPGIAIVNPDAIEEFKIQTSMFDAGYGRKPGASVNVVTKSGTNQFHGDVFEFFRNTALNANDFFRQLNYVASPTLPSTRPILNQNQYGGVIGGPVKKDRLFFFASYQETYQKNGLATQGASDPILVGIPGGDRSTPAFQASLGAAFCPGGPATIGGGASVKQTNQGGTQVACNGSNINPVALAILNLKNPDGSYYIPSSGATGNVSSFLSDPAKFEEHAAIGNADYVINSKNTFSSRWSYSNAQTTATMGCKITSTTLTQCLPGGGALVTIPTQYFTEKLTSTLTNNLVNEARFSVQRIVGNPTEAIPFTDAQVGIAPLEPSVPYLLGMTITGLMQWGSALSNDTDKFNTSWEAADQISWSHGKHTLRAGFEYERDIQNWHFGGEAIGSETFTTWQDFLIGLPGCSPAMTAAKTCAASQASSTGPVLAGQTNGTSQSNVANTGGTAGITPPGGEDFEFRAPTLNAFVQDDYKVLHNLVLNLGVRWEYDGLNIAKNGENTNVWTDLINTVPNSQLGTTAATGTLAGFVVPANFPFANFPTPPVGGLFQSNKNIPTENSPSLHNFAPRIGLAWRPFSSDKFVFRSGFGSFYDRAGNTIYNKAATQGIPYEVSVAQTGSANWFATEGSPYCTAPTPGVACTAPQLGWTPRYFNPVTGTGSNLSILATAQQYYLPVTYEWNANIQYEFASNWVLELGYVGSHGVHQVPDATLGGGILEHNVNQPVLVNPNPASYCANGAATNLVCAAFAAPTAANAALRVPYLGFSPNGIGVDQTITSSKFDSLQATVTKRLSHGLTMQAAYTWARGFDTSSYITYNDASLPIQYGLMPYLRPQRLSINYSYELPFGHHTGVLEKVTGGWVVSGVTIAQNGFPQTITDANLGNLYGKIQTSTANYATGMGAANVATSGSDGSRIGGKLGTTDWYNLAAFTPASATANNGYGDSGYGTVLSPGQFNWDISLVKTTKVGGINENGTLVFRSEFFNAFNHPQFSPPVSNDVTSSSFGVINTLSVNPRLIQFALKYVF